MTDHKKLIQPLKNAPVLNKLLDAFLSSDIELEAYFDEAFRMLNIDECSGHWLDNLGLPIGVKRPVIKGADRFLKTDNIEDSLDSSKYFIKNAPTTEMTKLADDTYYRKLIKAQAFRNSMKFFSINALEKMAQLIFFEDHFKDFYIEYTDFKKGKISVHVDTLMSHDSIAFLQNFSYDSLKRKRFHFPYPPQINSVTIVQDL